ncbi:MAG TPA: bifunctional proline dehydrogenase/L-glutamate gamma-semialdehyde dehydrogenase, partial [Verrucomicrobiales bacterium]|nr:bifunctional proline dehydrogenase/L-glutamate gamma-semialdehyde dehydrogenase [Verrucomicrobiales bacterium]
MTETMTAPGQPAGQTAPAAVPPADTLTAQKAVALADELLRRALEASLPEEREKARQMSGLISDPAAKALTMAMTDRLIRSEDAPRAAAGWRAVLSRFGLPRGFPLLDRALLWLGATASNLLPGVVMKAVRRRLRKDSSGVILAAENEPLTRYLAERQAAGMRTNVNQLGEAVLGEGEAGHRLEAVLALLKRADVDYISVKLSAIFSQIQIVAWDQTLAAAKERLRILYRAALPGGKMVNLDMEEYRDLALTTAAFCEVLDEPEFRNVRAGIVLQAYLPDSFEVLRRLTSWAQERLTMGGLPIKIRLVKGANLAMEAVEAELHGWNAAPYTTKEETDANYRRMMDYACRRENTAAVRVGVASHNLFDVALALVLREERELGDAVEIEMLEGMANHQARAVRDQAGGLLLYAPVVHEKDFGAALAYLIRRLDENTSPENFLSGVFSFTPDSAEWREQRRRFLEGWTQRNEVSALSRRAVSLPHSHGGFFNESETDFTQEKNRQALERAMVERKRAILPEVSSVEAIPAVLDRAVAAQAGWESMGDSHRADVLRNCAAVMSAHRFEIIALLRSEGKKAVLDADGEVSEAVDFARYYAETGVAPVGVKSKAFGTVIVTPPWNFPFAIPCGGVLAALMAGNTVILKPAPETVELGWLLANLLWQAGVPRDVLQYVRCEDGDAGKALITDPRTNAVVLTGAYETAKLFLGWRPALRLFAETSGKNSIVVSALADRDLAVKDLVRSAFGHAGQKCSAASLGILEAEVYDDPAFRRQLRDAAASLHVGPATDPASVVTPVIREASENLKRAL